MRFDTTTFTPIVASSQLLGWAARIMEQRVADALLRPPSTCDQLNAACVLGQGRPGWAPRRERAL
jgi:hypothetical protein